MTHPARRLWQRLEVLHEVFYFVPEVRAAGKELGLAGYWMTYFAFRAAPLGRVEADPTTAIFAVFDPGMVGRALPEAWARTTPQACLDARLTVATAALRAIGVDERACARAVELLAPVAAAADRTGRPLGSANAAVPLRKDPVGALWQLATTFRELRGDGHVAALVHAGCSGLEAHFLRSGGREPSRTVRGWSESAWAACGERLRGEGLLDVDNRPTDDGRARLDKLERTTDELAWNAALAALGDTVVDAVIDLLQPSVDLVWAAGILPEGERTELIEAT